MSKDAFENKKRITQHPVFMYVQYVSIGISHDIFHLSPSYNRRPGWWRHRPTTPTNDIIHSYDYFFPQLIENNYDDHRLIFEACMHTFPYYSRYELKDSSVVKLTQRLIIHNMQLALYTKDTFVVVVFQVLKMQSQIILHILQIYLFTDLSFFNSYTLQRYISC